jgi:hypothetical protein
MNDHCLTTGASLDRPGAAPLCFGPPCCDPVPPLLRPSTGCSQVLWPCCLGLACCTLPTPYLPTRPCFAHGILYTMGSYFSFFRKSDQKFAGYERSLEKIDREIQSVQDRIGALEARKRQLKSFMLLTILASCIVSAVYMFQLKFWEKEQGHWSHFIRVGVAISVPCSVVLLGELCAACLRAVGSMYSRQSSRLEKHQSVLLKELKDATYYDQVFSIIEKYEPSRSLGKDHSQFSSQVATSREQGHTPAYNSPMLRQGGGAVMHLLQTTGSALSPVMEKLASMMEDDPMQAAAFRQMLHEKQALQQEVSRLRLMITQAGLNPEPTAEVLTGAASHGEEAHRAAVEFSHSADGASLTQS